MTEELLCLALIGIIAILSVRSVVIAAELTLDPSRTASPNALQMLVHAKLSVLIGNAVGFAIAHLILDNLTSRLAWVASCSHLPQSLVAGGRARASLHSAPRQ